jgi:hypothetical protein
LTADRFAKRAMPGGPFCKLDRRQGHVSSPSARSPSRYQRRPHAVGSGLLASTGFGFATIVGARGYVQRQWPPIGVPGL